MIAICEIFKNKVRKRHIIGEKMLSKNQARYYRKSLLKFISFPVNSFCKVQLIYNSCTGSYKILILNIYIELSIPLVSWKNLDIFNELSKINQCYSNNRFIKLYKTKRLFVDCVVYGLFCRGVYFLHHFIKTNEKMRR